MLLIYWGGFDTFATKDFEILKEKFDIVPLFNYHGRKDIFRVARGVLTTDISISLFAGDHAAAAVFFSRLFRKKSIVMVCGGDVANMPEIDYGDMRLSKFHITGKFALDFADAVAAISEYSMRETLRYSSPKIKKVICHGFDHEKYKPEGEKDKKLVITIGAVNSSTLLRKGIKTFVEAARHLPDLEFAVIGKYSEETIEKLRAIASPNVRFAGFVPLDELLDYMRKASVYVQVSAHEGFGCSLAEAMLCECVPVVTDRGGIPEVVGDTGVYVPYNDPKATAEGIGKALKMDGAMARERVKNLFPLEKRGKELLETVDDVLAL